MSGKTFHSWGRVGPVFAEAVQASWRQALPVISGERLAYGLGRSYGDSCLLGEGTMIETTGLDRLISFDPASGVVVAEAGLSLDALLRFSVPRGWFLPVTPGTRLVTLGGEKTTIGLELSAVMSTGSSFAVRMAGRLDFLKRIIPSCSRRRSAVWASLV
jgi:FAD binding domain